MAIADNSSAPTKMTSTNNDSNSTKMPSTDKVPVTILTGFLGSGKTTLLRYILKENHGYKIAVIQNEYAEEMGIEAPTLTDGRSGEQFKDLWELPNGCICCSAKDDFISAVDTLLEVHKQAAAKAADGKPVPKPFDYIVVESTGLADPEQLVSTFWVDDGLGSHIFLDGVVCVVDTGNVVRLLTGDVEENRENMEVLEVMKAQSTNADAKGNTYTNEQGEQGSPKKRKVEAPDGGAVPEAMEVEDEEDDDEPPQLQETAGQKTADVRDSETTSRVTAAAVTMSKRSKIMKAASAGWTAGQDPDARKNLDSMRNDALKQVYCADVILCNKMDLFMQGRTGTTRSTGARNGNTEPSEQQQKQKKRETLAFLQQQNPDATLFETTYSKVQLGDILNLRAFDPRRTATRLGDFSAGNGGEGEAHSHDEGHGHGHSHDAHGHGHSHEEHGHGHSHEEHAHSHDHNHTTNSDDVKRVAHGIESILCKFPEDVIFDCAKLEQLLAEILWEQGEEEEGEGNSGNTKPKIVRAKGIFKSFEDEEIFQEWKRGEQSSNSGSSTSNNTSKITPEVKALQSVGEIFELIAVHDENEFSEEQKRAQDERMGGGLEPKFLFLGKHLDKKMFMEKLRGCAF